MLQPGGSRERQAYYEPGESDNVSEGGWGNADFAGEKSAMGLDLAHRQLGWRPKWILRHTAQRSRKLSSACCISGDKKYSITRRLPVLISTDTAIPGLKDTGVPSTLMLALSILTRIE